MSYYSNKEFTYEQVEKTVKAFNRMNSKIILKIDDENFRLHVFENKKDLNLTCPMNLFDDLEKINANNIGKSIEEGLESSEDTELRKKRNRDNEEKYPRFHFTDPGWEK